MKIILLWSVFVARLLFKNTTVEPRYNDMPREQ